ncbi:RNA-binding S4 domain-containing protein [Ruania zhangjianzhongii]|uniref:RNA-binding S4 domain-containing protein n=1 Tax=Ruania zhangjianzhongii TaxID=2603206 RepID=UPI0011C9A802|nr:RNA-binding S4 domain-containing protein [Ruania zhangjianzhongii]
MATAETEDVPITGEMIRLGQLLKLTGICEDGASARILLSDDAVQVNGETETRRGRQLTPGDLLEIDLPHGERRLRVTSD